MSTLRYLLIKCHLTFIEENIYDDSIHAKQEFDKDLLLIHLRNNLVNEKNTTFFKENNWKQADLQKGDKAFNFHAYY